MKNDSRWVLILTLSVALCLSLIDGFRSERVLIVKNRLIYDLGQDKNYLENQNSLLKKALLEK